jgi:hypothetical protein
MLRERESKLGHGHAGHVPELVELPLLSLLLCPAHLAIARHLAPLRRLAPAVVEEEHRTGQTSTRPWRPGRRSRRACAHRGHVLATRRATISRSPWPR